LLKEAMKLLMKHTNGSVANTLGVPSCWGTKSIRLSRQLTLYLTS
jgi:hypothetical protein